MRVAIFGARGMIGSRIANELLARDHQVTAVVRSLSPALPEGLGAVTGDSTDAAQVAMVVSGNDAVISAVGGAGAGEPRVVVDTADALIDGLNGAGVKRLLLVGGAGGLLTEGGRRVIDMPDFPEAWKPASAAQIDALQIYRERGGGLDWTYISPADRIDPGVRTGRYATDFDRLVIDTTGGSYISAEDFAIAVVDQLETPTAIRRRIAVGPV